jgi:hypothetical protein
MLVSRRAFLKLILETAPAVALSGPLSALWPAAAKARPVAEPVTLFLDRDFDPDHAYLVDDLDPDTPANEDFPPRRAYFELETMSLSERVDFWREGWGRNTERFEAFLWNGREVEDWSADDLARFHAFEAEQAAWLDQTVGIDEMSSRDLAFLTRMGPGIELYEALGPKRARALGIYEAFFGGMGSDGYGIAFRGDLDTLNAALAARGINVVVEESPVDDWGDEDWEEDDVPEEGAWA